MLRDELESYLGQTLSVDDFNDYCPNGLQVEGKSQIKKIITGVTASQALIDCAIEEKADAVLVHHGYFWKGESSAITRLKKQRISSLLQNDISLFAYHLPLDAHPELGNNAQLANLLGLVIEGGLEKHGPHDLGLVCRLPERSSVDHFQNQLAEAMGRKVMVLGPEEKFIEKVALCTGAAQSMFEDAIVNHDVDAYLSGEVSEPVFHLANEYQRNYFALGHHASERYGVKALGEHLQAHFDIECVFKDLNNPI
jgi:dinuclear metal center YbgI/SA1388 family protein